MIDKGMDNKNQVLQGLIDKANKRIAEIESGEKPALTPDANAKYYAEVEVDLDLIAEPMIADPDVNNADVSKRYTHDTIRPLSYHFVLQCFSTFELEFSYRLCEPYKNR